MLRLIFLLAFWPIKLAIWLFLLPFKLIGWIMTEIGKILIWWDLFD